PASGRAGRGQQPLAGALQPAPFTSTALQVGVLTDGCRPYGLAVVGCARRYRPCWLLPLRVAPASLVGRPLAGGLGCALAVGGRQCMGAGRG
ncbi:hypothetical protein B296_00058586, partial [Ensete ventricosum]